MKRSILLLLILLGACAPATRLYPPETPILYPTSYRNLFETTLQELTTAYIPNRLERNTFSVTQADFETGLITAVRNERAPTVNYRYRFPSDDEDVYDRSDFLPGLGLALTLPLQSSQSEQTIITVVIRRVGQQASLVYSTQGPDGTSSNDGTQLMRGVVAALNARFLTPETAPGTAPETP